MVRNNPTKVQLATDTEQLAPDAATLPCYGAIVYQQESDISGENRDDLNDNYDPAPPVGDEADQSLVQARARLPWTFPILAIGIFLAAGDQTVIVSSYGHIGSDMKELNRVAWLATAYLCTTTAFQPLYGKFAGIFGRRTCLLFAYSSMNQLIAARALTGIGAGGIITTVSIVLSDLVPLSERAMWQGYVNMVFACGAGLGAPLGGILTDAIGWRWAFILQAPLCVPAITVVVIFLRLPRRREDDSYGLGSSPVKSTLARVDFPGAALLITFLLLLLLLLDRVSSPGDSNVHDWISWSMLTGSAGLLLIFLHVERTAANPFMPLRILFGREYLGAYLALCFGNVAWYGVIFYVPMLYQAVGRFGASEAGTLLLPGIVAGVVGGFLGGAYIKRRSPTGFRRLAFICYPLVTASGLGTALATQLFWTGITTAGLILTMSGIHILGGMGNGGGMAATLVVVVAVAPARDQAIVTACIYFYRQFGVTVGLAAISLVFRRVLAWALVRRLTGYELDIHLVVRRVLESLDYLDQLPLQQRALVEMAYGDACRAALLVCAVFGACAIVSVAFIREKKKEERMD